MYTITLNPPPPTPSDIDSRDMTPGTFAVVTSTILPISMPVGTVLYRVSMEEDEAAACLVDPATDNYWFPCLNTRVRPLRPGESFTVTVEAQ